MLSIDVVSATLDSISLQLKIECRITTDTSSMKRLTSVTGRSTRGEISFRKTSKEVVVCRAEEPHFISAVHASGCRRIICWTVSCVCLWDSFFVSSAFETVLKCLAYQP